MARAHLADEDGPSDASDGRAGGSFSLSFRDIEEMMAERGVIVTSAHDSAMVSAHSGKRMPMRCAKRRGKSGDKWHLDEVFLTNEREDPLPLASSGSGWQRARYAGRRADGTRKAAKKFFRKLLKGLQYVPRVIITDKLRSYGAAKREILPGVEHRQQKGLNNRAENSHQPTRLREKKMRRLRVSPHKHNGFFLPLVPFQGISSRDVTA